MNTEIFLNGFDYKKATNTSEGLDVRLKGKRRLLSSNEFGDAIISQYDQYMEERGNCNIIRLTCQVNVVASNVLSNKISEIVRNEGSPEVSLINYGIANDNDFNDVVFKARNVDFWAGNNWDYQSRASWDVNTIEYRLFDGQNNYEYLTNGSHSGDMKSTYHCTNAIRDTQLSNCGFVYHCGLDILNNHLIRSNVFKWVNKLNGTDAYAAFNTIGDLFRDVRGNNIVERIYFPQDAGVRNNTKLLSLHLYEYDDVDTFLNARRTKLLDRFDGWFGFKNNSKIKTYRNFQTNDFLKIDKPIMYANGGDFIELYPDNKLYSFVPLYNQHQHRVEKNWNYCITYPSSSTTEGFDDIIERNYGVNALRALYFDENTRHDNGMTQLVIHSIAKHGLSVGDYVNIYKSYETTVFWVIDTREDNKNERVSQKSDNEDFIKMLCDQYNAEYLEKNILEVEGPYKYTHENELYTTKIIDNTEVSEVVDDYTFVVFNSDVQISRQWVALSDIASLGMVLDKTIKHQWVCTKPGSAMRYYVVNESYVNIDNNAQNISFKKVVNDMECDYYVRIFSKLPNFKFSSADTSNSFELYKNDQATIKRYRDIQYDFQSSPTKLSYAQNIYGDLLGQIVFLDDIDLSNIVDNLGRPLTSLYLTFIKNNKGYKEWYGMGDGRKIWNNGRSIRTEYENIEFSHCFGAITCGIECSDNSAANGYINNIKTITNLLHPNTSSGHGYSMLAINKYEDILVDKKFTSSDDNGRRKYNSSNETDETEIIINDNEIWYDIDENFYGDLCYYDNYNSIERPIQQIMHRFNTAQRECFGSAADMFFSNYNYDEIWMDDYDLDNNYEIRTYSSEACNVLNEGYYYQPHYEIPIHYYGKINYLFPDFLTIRQIRSVGDNRYVITCLENHFLSVGDKAIIYDEVDDLYLMCATVSGENDSYKVFTCDLYEYDTNKETNKAKLRLVNDSRGVIFSNNSGINRYKLFKIDNLNIPSYAKLLRDGTCRFIWRNIFKNGIGTDKKEIEEYTFTNNAFYINRSINLYVRRQDPHRMYGLYSDFDRIGNEQNIIEEDNYFKEPEIEC